MQNYNLPTTLASVLAKKNKKMSKRGIFMLAAAAAMLSVDLPYYAQEPERKRDIKPIKPPHRPLTKFIIKGVEVYACSKKDALTRCRHKHNNN